MALIQIIALIISVVGIARTVVLFKNRKLSIGWLVFWLAVWGGVSVTAFIPRASYWVSSWFGIKSGLDFLIYLSIIVLFYLVFKLSLKIDGLEGTITKLVRELALRRK